MEWEGEAEVLIHEAYNHSEVKDIHFQETFVPKEVNFHTGI